MSIKARTLSSWRGGYHSKKEKKRELKGTASTPKTPSFFPHEIGTVTFLLPTTIHTVQRICLPAIWLIKNTANVERRSVLKHLKVIVFKLDVSLPKTTSTQQGWKELTRSRSVRRNNFRIRGTILIQIRFGSVYTCFIYCFLSYGLWWTVVSAPLILSPWCACVLFFVVDFIMLPNR